MNMKLEAEIEMRPRKSTQAPWPQIVCPTCRTGALALKNSAVQCADCGASFPVTNGVIDLIPEPSSKRRFWQDIVDWNVFVQLYESRLWRTGPFGNIFFGISFKKELEVIMQALALQNEGKLLDIACGPGIYTRPFARRLHRGTVVGLDLSMPMVTYAHAKAQSEGIPNIFFIHGDAQDLPFPDNELDAASCCGALHLFPDLPKTLSGVFRVLKPGGRIAVAAARVPSIGPAKKRLRDWYHRRTGVKAFFVEELASLFGEAGFSDFACHHAVRWWIIVSAVKPG
jgi:SAM-dependent methyltransferase